MPEEKKSGFGKILGVFRNKEKNEPLPEQTVSQGIEHPAEEEKSFEEIQEEEGRKLQEAELEKEKQEAKEMTQKYGVSRGIPKREIAEEFVETSKKDKEDLNEEIDIPELLLRLEKIDGKLELFDNSKNESNERITQLAEEIGELRSMIMERERSFSKMETEFETVKEAVSGLEPQRIKSAFEKRKMEILENKAKIEELETLVRALNEDVKKFRGLLEKIKSFENIVDLSFDMDRKVSEVREVKDYADKIAAKVENIFSELSTKVSDLEGQREKVDKLDELTIEMTKMLDEVSVKLTKFAEEKDLKELQKTIEDNFKKTMEEHSKKTTEIKAPANVKITGDKVIQAFQSEISQLSTRVTKLKSVVETQNSVINNIIEYLQGSETQTTQEQPIQEEIQEETEMYQ